MRYALIADIHSNIEALRAVLDDVSGDSIIDFLCCGDVVGYYANPNECVEALSDLNIVAVAGNHDLAVAGLKLDLSSFWSIAARAVKWSRRRVSEQNKNWLRALPERAVVDDLILFHGCLHQELNAEDLHLYKYEDVRASLFVLEGMAGLSIGFFGHTHKQVACWHQSNNLVISQEKSLKLKKGRRYLINPGSVGRSRDDPDYASYAVYDSDRGTVEFRRVIYDRKSCLENADKSGLLTEPLWSKVKRKMKQIDVMLGNI